MSKDRYIEAKQKWAEKQLAKGFKPRDVAASDRLPPGQKLTTGFPVLDLGVQPAVPLNEWSLTLDGLVDNAGIAIAAPLELVPLDELRRQLEVNVVGQVAVTQAFLPALRRSRGRIVLMGSIGGRSALPPCPPADVESP